MKRYFLSLFALVFLPLGAWAQGASGPHSWRLLSGLPATVTTGSTSNLTASAGIIDCTRSTSLALVFIAGLHAAGTGNITLTFSRSIDGSNFSTEAGSRFTWVVAASGTNILTHATNVTVGAYGWIKLVSILNEGGDTLTNRTSANGVWAGTKREF